MSWLVSCLMGWLYDRMVGWWIDVGQLVRWPAD